jgi:hypothetical protein
MFIVYKRERYTVVINGNTITSNTRPITYLSDATLYEYALKGDIRSATVSIDTNGVYRLTLALPFDLYADNIYYGREAILTELETHFANVPLLSFPNADKE